MLRFSGVKLQLSQDYDMLLFFSQSLKGGVSQCCLRYCEANNKYMGDRFKPEHPSSYISYLDVNGLYSWAMTQPLPVSDFKWLDEEENDYFIVSDNNVLNIDENFDGKGFFFEVTIIYSQSLHDLHRDLPFLPIIKFFILYFESTSLWESFTLIINPRITYYLV